MKFKMKFQSHTFWILFLFFTKFEGYCGLKNVRLKTNSAVRSGDSLKLKCDYDLENALLYSIKWYFGNEEFYRFVPKESPPTRVFPFPGISVDLSESDNKAVTLRNVQRDQSGYYKCEVSADAPLFHTDIKSALVIVVEVPESGPTIFSQKTKLPDTDLISAICTAGNAHPAANFTWYMNGKMVNLTNTEITLEFTVFSDTGDGMETSRSKLNIPISSTPRLFVDGKLKLKCEATQFDIYAESVETEIVDYVPQLAHVLSLYPLNNSGNHLLFSEFIWILISICQILTWNYR